MYRLDIRDIIFNYVLYQMRTNNRRCFDFGEFTNFQFLLLVEGRKNSVNISFSTSKQQVLLFIKDNCDMVSYIEKDEKRYLCFFPWINDNMVEQRMDELSPDLIPIVSNSLKRATYPSEEDKEVIDGVELQEKKRLILSTIKRLDALDQERNQTFKILCNLIGEDNEFLDDESVMKEYIKNKKLEETE
jgi:hypothetical protein